MAKNSKHHLNLAMRKPMPWSLSIAFIDYTRREFGGSLHNAPSTFYAGTEDVVEQ